MIFYISDTHIGHANIVKYDSRAGGRTFQSVEEHDNLIIENWNRVVKKQDTVYILGDFSWLDPRKTKEILEKLNGQKFLIRGNHDRFAKDGACKKMFQAIYDYKQINDNGREVFLSHYPIMMWNGQHRGTIHLYGHVHNSNEENDFRRYLNDLDANIRYRDGFRYKQLKAYNVGASISYMDFTPRTLDEILS